MDDFCTIICTDVPAKQAQKLEALAHFGGHDVAMLAGVLLAQAIKSAWEGYRNNPKHSNEIEKWEEEHK